MHAYFFDSYFGCVHAHLLYFGCVPALDACTFGKILVALSCCLISVLCMHTLTLTVLVTTIDALRHFETG